MTKESIHQNFHPASKIWVYQSSREFTGTETEAIILLGDAFVEQWAAHGSKLKAGFNILYNRFVILIADESQAMASGCSIDSSVGLIRKIEGMFNLNLLDRMQVAYKFGGNILTTHLSDFESKLKEGILNADTIVFNILIQTLGELVNNWELPVKESWHQRLL
ncbi:MAG: ABC transporter ATPase [Bacteroidetes bacterium]|nr:ABC transporter ATPase [Bacteroidota bacterium]